MAAIIVLQSSDDRLFKVDVNVAKMSTTIKDMLDNLGDPEEGKEEIIPVQVEGDIMEKVLEWAEYHLALNVSILYKLLETTFSLVSLKNEMLEIMLVLYLLYFKILYSK